MSYLTAANRVEWVRSKNFQYPFCVWTELKCASKHLDSIVTPQRLHEEYGPTLQFCRMPFPHMDEAIWMFHSLMDRTLFLDLIAESHIREIELSDESQRTKYVMEHA